MEFCRLSKNAEILLKSICKAKKLGKDPARVVMSFFEKTGKYSEYDNLMPSTIRDMIRELEGNGYITTQWAGDTLTLVLVNVSIEVYREKLRKHKRQRNSNSKNIFSKILGFFRS